MLLPLTMITTMVWWKSLVAGGELLTGGLI